MSNRRFAGSEPLRAGRVAPSPFRCLGDPLAGQESLFPKLNPLPLRAVFSPFFMTEICQINVVIFGSESPKWVLSGASQGTNRPKPQGGRTYPKC